MRDRAYRRAQVKRVANKRRRWLPSLRKASDNELAIRHPLDCGRKCFLCHGDKLLDATARRVREMREAAVREDRAW